MLQRQEKSGETIDFGLLKRDGQVYVEIVPNTTEATQQAFLRDKASFEAVLHTDRRRGYDGFVHLDFDEHLGVNHGDNEFAFGPNHINGIESFWSYAKHRPAKFHDMKKRTFHLHLK
jgi:transposase-like protein